MSKHSEACCRIPAVVSEGYEPKGKYIELEGMKTYVTGPDTATEAILFIFDIFGFFPQTIQGADIYASDPHHPYQVYMPDLFYGEPLDSNLYPPSTEEQKAAVGKWFGEKLSVPGTLEKLPSILKAAEAQNPNIKSWGAVGYCWGGKVTALAAGKDSLFKVAIASSPAFIDPEDGTKITIPFAMLASKEEPVDAVKELEGNVTTTKHFEFFPDQPHGWMSARANLKDSKAKDEYERGYQIALTFFQDNM